MSVKKTEAIAGETRIGHIYLGISGELIMAFGRDKIRKGILVKRHTDKYLTHSKKFMILDVILLITQLTIIGVFCNTLLLGLIGGITLMFSLLVVYGSVSNPHELTYAAVPLTELVKFEPGVFNAVPKGTELMEIIIIDTYDSIIRPEMILMTPRRGRTSIPFITSAGRVSTHNTVELLTIIDEINNA